MANNFETLTHALYLAITAQDEDAGFASWQMAENFAMSKGVTVAEFGRAKQEALENALSTDDHWS